MRGWVPAMEGIAGMQRPARNWEYNLLEIRGLRVPAGIILQHRSIPSLPSFRFRKRDPVV
jgi:hypothetical protein